MAIVSVPLRGKYRSEGIVAALGMAKGLTTVSVPLRGKYRSEVGSALQRVVAQLFVSVPLRGKYRSEVSIPSHLKPPVPALGFRPLAG